MTINEFIQKLQEIDLHWELRNSALRAREGELNHCVASAVLDDIHTFSDPSTQLHKRLGLSMIDALTIVTCAERQGPFSRFDPDLRKKLLKACGVIELER